MDDTATTQNLRRRKSQPNSPVFNSESLPLQDFRQHTLRPSSPASASQETRPDQADFNVETSLLNEAGPTHIATPTRWTAFGPFAISVLVLGTIGIVAGIALLAHIWRSSMRAQAGHMDNGQLWHLIIRGNRASVTVTLTAAVIRVCLGFQTGILTGMIASLLIERTGVPLSSAPLISMLRALSTSPYNLVSRKTLSTPFAIAILLAALLTGASNFTSTALLIDFENTNITTAKQTTEVLYGSSEPEAAAGPGASSDIPGTSEAGGALRGFKIWNSQPNTYFRLAGNSDSPVPSAGADGIDDSGSVVRAILPFPNIADRINLRGYEGRSVVFDSRVVCTRPKLNDIKFSAVVTRRSDMKTSRFDEIFVEENFSLPIPDEFPLLHSEFRPPPNGWRMRCVIPAPKAAEQAIYQSTSICSVKLGILTQHSDITRYPLLRSTVLPIPRRWTTTFLIFNTTGPIEEWRDYLTEDGQWENEAYLLWQSAKKANWTLTEDGIWAGWRPPHASMNISISISACSTNLAGVYQEVRMLSDHNGLEPSLSWDSVNERYNTSLIRERYANLPADSGNTTSRGFRDALDLHPQVGWKIENFTDADDMLKDVNVKPLDYWMFFSSITRGLPYMNLNGNDEGAEFLPSGILFPGAFSAYSVHYAHAALFQDLLETTGSLAKALQGLFTVLRQMTYYENSPYFDKKSTASLALSSEKLIPTRWTGFILVTVTVVAHFVLLAVITGLFLGWTRATWLGNVWVSVSQVVSSKTKDVIDMSTDKDDEAVERTILRGASGPDGKSKYKVRVLGNESNGRNELSLI